MALTDFEDSGFEQTFWVPFAIITAIGLFIMLLEGISLINQGQTQAGMQVVLPALVFLLMFLFANLVEIYAHMQDEDHLLLQLYNDSPQELSLMFYAGFLFWSGLLWIGKLDIFSTVASVVASMPTISIMSTAEDGLTDAQYVFVNGVMAPYVEEIFMFGAMVLMVWFLLDALGVKHRVVKPVVALLVISPLFASFHVDSPVFSTFWIAAFTFSMLVRGAALLDLSVDVARGVAILVSFTIGAHMAHNFHHIGGIVAVFATLWQDILLFVSVAGLFLVLGLWAVQGLVNLGEY